MQFSSPGPTVKEFRMSGWPNCVCHSRSSFEGSVSRQETLENVVSWIGERHTPLSLLTDMEERDRRNDSPRAAAAVSKCFSPRNFLFYWWRLDK